MIGLPVALMTAGATIARTSVKSPQDEITGTMGAADLMFSPSDRSHLERFRKHLPKGSDVVTVRAKDLSLIQGGSLVDAALVEPNRNMDDPMFKGFYELQTGRAPRRPGEAAVQEDLLHRFGASIGDRIDLGGYNLTVVGTARYPQSLDFGLAVVGPGTLSAHVPISTVLVDVPPGVSASTLDQRYRTSSVTTRQKAGAAVVSDAGVWDGVSFIGGVLAFFGTGLIAAAAFVVGARRQLHELGIIQAAGGEPRHARAIVLLTGTTLGLAGSLMGCLAGLGLAYAAHPFLSSLIGRVVGPVEVNGLVFIGAVLMGTLAATIAAFGPARAVAKASVVEALAGRGSQPRPPGRVAATGGLVMVAGSALTAWATISNRNAFLAAGLVMMLVGVLFAIPLLVSVVGKLASRLPLSGRIAARDAARHGRRTGAAVAAAVIALAIPVAVATYSLSEETFERQRPPLGSDQLHFGSLNWNPTEKSSQAFGADIRRAFPQAIVAPLTQALFPRTSKTHSPSPVFVNVKDQVSAHSFSVVAWEVFVGGRQLLHALHADSGGGALVQGKAVVLGGFDTNAGHVRVPGVGGGDSHRGVRIPAVAVHSPAYSLESIPRIVISPRVAAQLGLRTDAPAQYLLQKAGAISGSDIERARKVAEDHPGTWAMSAADYLPKFGMARTAAAAVSLPLALAILAVAVALVVSESRRSHQLLTAVGAGPMTHRKIIGATSTLLALIAALLAVPAGILPTLVVQAFSGAGRPLVVPWMTIAVVVLVAPLVSGMLAGLMSRSPRLGSLLNPST
jgi:putative ABC transport system permease protein